MNSKTSAGGVGLYVSENVNFKRRNDLDLDLLEGLENRPFYSCLFSDLALDCKRGWG